MTDETDLWSGQPPITLASVRGQLLEPFRMEFIDLKPGAVARENDSALALFYADPRAYMERLDEVVGPDNWSARYTIQSSQHASGMICALTILGITKMDVADFDPGDTPNVVTSAAAQCFKRAAVNFGLGRYLYSLPQIWADFDKTRKRFKDPEAVIRRVYQAAGLV
jgi:hypothetical protein